MNAASDLETMEVVNAEKKMAFTNEKHGSHGESSIAGSSSDEFRHPTEEELATLTRVSGKIPWQAYTIAFVELCERFSYYGTTAVCTLLHESRWRTSWLTLFSCEFHSTSSTKR